MPKMPGYKAKLYISSSSTLTMTNLVIPDSGDHITFSLPVNHSQRYWSINNDPLIVETTADGSLWIPVTTGFSIQLLGGKIVFDSALTGTSPGVRVSGKYYTTSLLGGAKSVEIKNMVETFDSTEFVEPSSPWKTKEAGLADSDISLGKWWLDGLFLLRLNSLIIASLYTGANTNQRLEAYTHIKSDSIKIAVNALKEETIELTVHGKLYYIA